MAENMYGDITTAMKKQYNANIMLLSQQKQSRLSPYVRREPIQAEFSFYDGIGPTEAQPKGGRHSDTPLMETPHTRRRVQSLPYNWATLVDSTDIKRLVTDPTSPYAVNANLAFNRSKDRVIIDAAFADAYTGKEGQTVIPFPQRQVLPADVEKTGVMEGLTIEKLILTKEMFDKAEVDETEARIIAVSASQISNLLRTTEVTNADYNTVKALAAGTVDSFMGFKFVRLELLNLDPVTSVRDCIAWVPSGLLLAYAEDVRTRIDPRPDKNYSTQVYVEMDLGGARMEEVKVIKVQCKEGK